MNNAHGHETPLLLCVWPSNRDKLVKENEWVEAKQFKMVEVLDRSAESGNFYSPFMKCCEEMTETYTMRWEAR